MKSPQMPSYLLKVSLPENSKKVFIQEISHLISALFPTKKNCYYKIVVCLFFFISYINRNKNWTASFFHKNKCEILFADYWKSWSSHSTYWRLNLMIFFVTPRRRNSANYLQDEKVLKILYAFTSFFSKYHLLNC